MWIRPDTFQVYHSHAEIRGSVPGISLPSVLTEDALLSLGVLPLSVAPPPEFNPVTHQLTETPPVLVDGVWQKGWQVTSLFEEYTDAEGVLHTVEQQEAAALMLAAQQAALEVQQAIVEATQKRLDDFAKTRNYDGILSGCTYATSAIPKFQTEGQYCVGARDATWAALYQILADVQAGTRTMPTGYADIEPDLPVLTWPA